MIYALVARSITGPHLVRVIFYFFVDSFHKGLRMHPLSWNVFGGHLENIQLLLDHKANVNADFDTMVNQKPIPVTALDIALQLEQNSDDEDGAFAAMVTMLKKYGAKTIKELTGGDEL